MPKAKQQSTLSGLQLLDSQDDVIKFDTALRVFGIRLRRGAGGRMIRNYIAQYRAGGRARRMIIGSADVLSEAQAREQAKKLLAQVALGGDPAAEKAKQRAADDISLKQVCEDYVAHKKLSIKPNSYAQLHHYLVGQLPGPHKNWRSKRNVKSWIAPLHNRPAHSITWSDISLAIKHCEEGSGKPSAVALRSALSAMFSWAIREGHYAVDVNVVTDAREVDTSDYQTSARVLDSQELAAIWRNLDDNEYGAVVKLLILCGARRSEVGGMRWSEIDLSAGTWTIPLARLKNRRVRLKYKLGPHVIALSPMMKAIIERIPRRVGQDHLFGQKAGFTNFSDGKKTLDGRVGLGAWKTHDVRRSFATALGKLGTPKDVVDFALGHVEGGITTTYNKSLYEEQTASALLMWSQHVAEITHVGAARDHSAIPSRA